MEHYITAALRAIYEACTDLQAAIRGPLTDEQEQVIEQVKADLRRVASTLTQLAES